ncbi:hypothetical protein [Cesiribacter andamanensis]|uniref:Lipoprotein n=1 Tax=Cesiribacter andamanensis AMV16 TaxID=1279009 RepID=M7N4U1_9BACT|nr:hypothetical protein [Cesiribacter andamanensis]EMR02241.1 hypothetical protein ADICEAN_02636 [Cesiribacter andamanensis AMV16]
MRHHHPPLAYFLKRLLPGLLLLGLLAACARPFVRPELTHAPFAPAGSSAHVLDLDLGQAPIIFAQPHARKLQKRNLYLFAVRIGNASPDTLWLTPHELELYSGGKPLPRVEARLVQQALRQPVALHALWLLAGPFVREDAGRKVLDYYPLGVAAAAWGIGNMVVAYNANRGVKQMIELSMPEQPLALPPQSQRYVILAVSSPLSPQGVRLHYQPPGQGDTP